MSQSRSCGKLWAQRGWAQRGCDMEQWHVIVWHVVAGASSHVNQPQGINHMHVHPRGAAAIATHLVAQQGGECH
jgi:hypothetical protein